MNEHFHFTHMWLSCLLDNTVLNKPNDLQTFDHLQLSVLHSVSCCFPKFMTGLERKEEVQCL